MFGSLPAQPMVEGSTKILCDCGLALKPCLTSMPKHIQKCVCGAKTLKAILEKHEIKEDVEALSHCPTVTTKFLLSENMVKKKRGDRRYAKIWLKILVPNEHLIPDETFVKLRRQLEEYGINLGKRNQVLTVSAEHPIDPDNPRANQEATAKKRSAVDNAIACVMKTLAHCNPRILICPTCGQNPVERIAEMKCESCRQALKHKERVMRKRQQKNGLLENITLGNLTLGKRDLGELRTSRTAKRLRKQNYPSTSLFGPPFPNLNPDLLSSMPPMPSWMLPPSAGDSRSFNSSPDSVDTVSISSTGSFSSSPLDLARSPSSASSSSQEMTDIHSPPNSSASGSVVNMSPISMQSTTNEVFCDQPAIVPLERKTIQPKVVTTTTTTTHKNAQKHSSTMSNVSNRSNVQTNSNYVPLSLSALKGKALPFPSAFPRDCVPSCAGHHLEAAIQKNVDAMKHHISKTHEDVVNFEQAYAQAYAQTQAVAAAVASSHQPRSFNVHNTMQTGVDMKSTLPGRPFPYHHHQVTMSFMNSKNSLNKDSRSATAAAGPVMGLQTPTSTVSAFGTLSNSGQFSHFGTGFGAVPMFGMQAVNSHIRQRMLARPPCQVQQECLSRNLPFQSNCKAVENSVGLRLNAASIMNHQHHQKRTGISIGAFEEKVTRALERVIFQMLTPIYDVFQQGLLRMQVYACSASGGWALFVPYPHATEGSMIESLVKRALTKLFGSTAAPFEQYIRRIQ